MDMYGLNRDWAKARRASQSKMGGSCVRGEVATGGRALPERADERRRRTANLIIDPSADTGRRAGERKESRFLGPVGRVGGQWWHRRMSRCRPITQRHCPRRSYLGYELTLPQTGHISGMTPSIGVSTLSTTGESRSATLDSRFNNIVQYRNIVHLVLMHFCLVLTYTTACQA